MRRVVVALLVAPLAVGGCGNADLGRMAFPLAVATVVVAGAVVKGVADRDGWRSRDRRTDITDPADDVPEFDSLGGDCPRGGSFTRHCDVVSESCHYATSDGGAFACTDRQCRRGPPRSVRAWCVAH